jgi:hypothetical protein
MSNSNDDKIEILREEHSDAKERIDQQSSIFSEFATEGQRMLRITLIYAGLLVNAINYLWTNESSFTFLAEVSFGVSALLIFGSLLFHTVGREFQGVKTLYEPDLDRELDVGELDDPIKYYEERINEYTSKISYNNDVLRVFETNLAIAKGLLTLSFGMTILGFSLVLGSNTVALAVSGFVIITVFYIYQVSNLPKEYFYRGDDSYSTCALWLRNWIKYLNPFSGDGDTVDETLDETEEDEDSEETEEDEDSRETEEDEDSEETEEDVSSISKNTNKPE